MSDSKQKVAESYTTKAGDYDQIRLSEPRGLLLSRHDIRLVNQILRPRKEMHLLELGAGTGRFTMPILERGYHVTATDINNSLLDGLREKVEKAGFSDRCTCQYESIFELSYEDNTQDFIYSFHVLPRFLSLEDQAQAIAEVGRVLKPGGQFLFNYRNSKSFYNLRYQGHAASPSEIDGLLSDAGMRIVHSRGKHFSNRTLYNKLPMMANHVLSTMDRMLHNVYTSRAWDVFALAEKTKD